MERPVHSKVKRKGHPATRPFIYISLGIVALVFGMFVILYLQGSRPMRCEGLLSTAETSAIFDAHQDSVTKVEELGGHGGMVSEREDCQGKAEILIYHGTDQQARAIRNYLGDSFFGAPYRLLNT